MVAGLYGVQLNKYDNVRYRENCIWVDDSITHLLSLDWRHYSDIPFDTSRPKQNVHRFADISDYIFLQLFILIKMSL